LLNSNILGFSLENILIKLLTAFNLELN